MEAAPVVCTCVLRVATAGGWECAREVGAAAVAAVLNRGESAADAVAVVVETTEAEAKLPVTDAPVGTTTAEESAGDRSSEAEAGAGGKGSWEVTLIVGLVSAPADEGVGRLELRDLEECGVRCGSLVAQAAQCVGGWSRRIEPGGTALKRLIMWDGSGLHGWVRTGSAKEMAQNSYLQKKGKETQK